MYWKTRKMEKLLIRSRKTYMMGWLQRRWISKINYPKGDSITEQNVAGWWTIIYPRHRLFFLFFFPKKKKKKQANLLQKPHKTRYRRHTDIHSHPTENSHRTHTQHSTQTTHNSPPKPKMCIWWYDTSTTLGWLSGKKTSIHCTSILKYCFLNTLWLLPTSLLFFLQNLFYKALCLAPSLVHRLNS